MAMKFTPDQQRVIDLRNCNILVSAAAGSGKTAVLVQRIVELVSDPVRGTDIDRLLIVTFTNAAAAQMRERITKALNDRAEAEPGNDHLKSQLTLIHNAKITTIDSFCLYLIRNHFNDIGLDPDFRTTDEGELRLLYQDILSVLLEEQFERKEEEFVNCVEVFAYDGREKRLEELILKLYDFSMSYPWPRDWLLLHREDYRAKDWEALEKKDWFQTLDGIIRGTLLTCQKQTEETIRICEEPDGPYMYAAALEADLAFIHTLLETAEQAKEEGQDGYTKLYEKLRGLVFSKLGVKKDPSVSAQKRELAKEGRERVKGLLKGLTEKYFYTSPKGWLAEMEKTAPALEKLVDLTLLFMERLEVRKREKNLLDFHDMEHMALQILLNHDEEGNTCPSRTALEYRQQFDEILIDEYQDSNLVQEFLLQSISGEDEGRFNRFMVGDVKQSIYKFRLARPELFMEKFDRYEKGQGNCVRVDLGQNFRSRVEVTDCVNDIFSRIMHRGLGGVEYDSDAALYPGALFPEGGGDDAPEFLVALTREDQENARELEARMVADRIKQIVGTLPVRDKETGQLRPARYQDIVILLRAASGWEEAFQRILAENGIPVFVTSKTGYFAATEVQNVLNFLRILNNPLQDIPMFGVLHSVIGGFTDAQIALLRAADETGKKKLYHCIKQFALSREGEEDVPAAAAFGREKAVLADKCRDFLELLNRFREYAVYLPIHNLIETFLEETGYLYTVSALPGGIQRRINVEMLQTRAENFEKTSYSGLFHFVRYMEQMERFSIDYGESAVMDENADIVRIMSIHKSKGLEFPVCFVSGLSKRFNRMDAAQPVILDMDLGLGTDCVDSIGRTRKTTLKKNVMAHKLLTDSLGEELRVLYVAMTRPEEKLILTASCKADKAPGENGGRETEISAARLQEASGFYEILLPAWQAAGRPVRCMEASDFLQEELTRAAGERNSRQRLELSDAKAFLETPEGIKLWERMHKRYAHENLAGLFVKTTVSELKKAGMQEEQEEGNQLFAPEEVIPYLPRFVKSQEEAVTGTRRGSAYHRILELFPFEGKERAADWTAADIEAVIRGKKESKELTEEFASAINPEKIASFLKTGLAERMRRAQEGGKLYREQPFVLGISADSLNPELPASETVLIQGIIDVFWEEEDGLVLADYKTDAVTDPQELARRYRVQLDYYEQALERLVGKRVKEKIIYSFALEKEILL